MENTEKKAEELYKFMGVPFTETVKEGLRNNFKADEKSHGVENGYFGVKRGLDFEHDKWKKTGSEKVSYTYVIW